LDGTLAQHKEKQMRNPAPAARSLPRRFDVLMSPREMTCLAPGDPRRLDRYRTLVPVARINVPHRIRDRWAVIHAAQLWAVRHVTFVVDERQVRP
jgi:hypothetical protein